MLRLISTILVFVVALAVLVGDRPRAEGGFTGKALREALEYAGRKFTKEVAEEGAERLSVRMTQLAAKHGDDLVAAALRRVGPRAGRVAEQAGEHGKLALKLLAKHGDDALPLVGKATALRTVARYGDDAAAAIVKHGAVGEKVVEQFAKEGAEALAKVTPQNGRRLAMMAAEGQLKPELMTVVARYGDEACDFIWRNKGSLAVGAALATFVASPEPYLEGTQQLVSTVAEAAVKPMAEVPKAVAAEAAANTNWTPIVIGLIVAAGLVGWRWTSRVRAVIAATESVRQQKDSPSWPRRDN